MSRNMKPTNQIDLLGSTDMFIPIKLELFISLYWKKRQQKSLPSPESRVGCGLTLASLRKNKYCVNTNLSSSFLPYTRCKCNNLLIN